MSYAVHVEPLRRCTATRHDGQPCQGWAVWTDPRQLCGAHGGRVPHPHVKGRGFVPPCHCDAYPFPHRPAAGLCCWPMPPEYKSLQPAGVHCAGYVRPDRTRRWG
ncbi:MAG TPA: hypothetical protein VF120_01700 [Ktedonobacterales bacterium]